MESSYADAAEGLPSGKETDGGREASGQSLRTGERAFRTAEQSFRAGERAAQGMDALADAQLVALARAGDRNAFEVLYRRHAAFALNLAVRIQGSIGDVEDVVHDAFLRANECLDELRDEGAFRGWLASIVVRMVRSRLRRARLLGSLGLTAQQPIDLDALAAEGAGPEMRALLAQVYGVLRRVPVDQRIAWTLRYVEKHTLPDVAQIVGCSLATVKRRVGAAQTALDAALSEGGFRE